MCGRYIIVESIDAIEKRFNAEARAIQTELKFNYNLSPGQKGPIITNTEPHRVQMFRFGYTPSWADKDLFIINARAEGKHNPDNDSDYNGAKGIIEMPSFRKQIRSQRCLIIASAFIEGPKLEKLDKPYLVYLQNKKRPFSFAGIWDAWYNKNKDETINTFAIITYTPNTLIQKIGHHRMPVILHQEDELTWLNTSTNLTNITRLLDRYPSDLMNAYPISPEIKNIKNNKRELLEPVGELLQPEYNYQKVTKIYPHSWGGRRKQIENYKAQKEENKKNQGSSN